MNPVGGLRAYLGIQTPFRATGATSMTRRILRINVLAVGLVALACFALAIGTRARALHASDHQDNPLVELNPAMDMTDVYAFPGATSDRTVLVLNSWAFLTPGQTASASFDPNLLYQFKIDNTGDAKEDRVIQVTFKGTAPNQTVEVRGPVAPPVLGTMMNQVANVDPTVTGAVGQVLGSPTGIQVFAGPREEPFFIDLEQFFRIIPDRKPSTGALSALPDAASASSFRSTSAAVDFTKGFNVMSIVVEIPTAQLTQGGNAKIGVWGTISR
jgi:hypothetical protein